MNLVRLTRRRTRERRKRQGREEHRPPVAFIQELQRLLRSDSGHGTYTFLAACVVLFPVAFLFLLNVSQAFLIKEVSNRAADQAALAVANTLYNSVWEKTRGAYVHCLSRDPDTGECIEWQTYEERIGKEHFYAQKERIDRTLPLYYAGAGDVEEACREVPSRCFRTLADEGWAEGRQTMKDVASNIAQKNGARLIDGPRLEVIRGDPSPRVVLITTKDYRGLRLGVITFGEEQAIDRPGISYPIPIADPLGR